MYDDGKNIYLRILTEPAVLRYLRDGLIIVVWMIMLLFIGRFALPVLGV